MPRIGERHHARSTSSADVFTPSLRYEFADEEGRTLLAAHGIAMALGAAFLLSVHFAPPTRRADLLPEERTVITVGELAASTATTVIPRVLANAARGSHASNAAAVAAIAGGDIDAAFRDGTATGRGIAADARDILRNVAVNAGTADRGTSGGSKVMLSGGGGHHVTTPGRGGIDGARGGDIGTVGARNGGVARSAVRLGAPPAVRIEPLSGAGGDASAIGTYVRTHTAPLSFCYEQRGLVADPRLAGSITVAIDVAESGTVRGSAVTARSWAGAAASDAEACILRAIRSWRLPASDRSSSTYTFVLNFTR